MEPALEDGSMVEATEAGRIAFGDIIIFKDSADGKPDIKRVVALPWQAVEIANSRLLVDSKDCGPAEAKGRAKWELWKGEYFVMGDNQKDSRDSRDFGPVKASQIIGKVLAPANAKTPSG